MEERQGMDHFTPSDRRELIELSVTMKNVRDDLQDMRSEATRKAIEQTKATEAGDSELEKIFREYRGEIDKRIRVLEDFRWYILGAVAAAGVLGGFFSKLFNH